MKKKLVRLFLGLLHLAGKLAFVLLAGWITGR